MKNCFFTLIILMSTISSCNSTHIFESIFQKKLDDWNFNSDVKVHEIKNTLIIEIFYKKDKSSSLNSYFLDEESNNVVVSMLNKTFYDELKKYEKITYELKFEDKKDMPDYTVVIDRESLDKTYINFEKSSLFYEFVEYAIVEIGSVDIIRCNAWIEYLAEESELFDFSGSFWTLLYNYSLACEEPKNKIKYIYLFIAFTGLINDPDNVKEDDINQEKLIHYIKWCNYDPTLIYLTLPQLIDSIDEIYTNLSQN